MSSGSNPSKTKDASAPRAVTIHIILVNYNDVDLSPEGRRLPPGAILDAIFLLRDWAQPLQRAGGKVSVFLRGAQEQQYEEQGVRYHFYPDRSPKNKTFWLPFRMHRAIARLAAAERAAGVPLVVHLNGLLFPLQSRLLRSALGPETPLLAQHHGSQPWAPGIRRSVQRWGLRAVDGFLFASPGLAVSWAEAGLIPDDCVHAVMELSSKFRLKSRAEARRKTGLRGKPVVIWAGNLNPNKDPLTVLVGFDRFLERRPDARLYMAYRAAPLEPEVRAFLAARPRLHEAVTLLGTIPYPDMEDFFNSADLFVQGSSREAAGLALLDALACGVRPVVTDIPAFREILKGGLFGTLWPVGDVSGFASALENALEGPSEPGAIRAFFDQHWSPEAVARQALAVYLRFAGSGRRPSGVPEREHG